MYERQHLRELEALRTDVANAAKKAAPVKPINAPRPTFVPPLEDFNRAPIPRPASGPPISAPNTSIRPGFGPVPPMSPAPMSAHPNTSLPPPGTTAIPLSVLIKNSLPPQSPGAGPSTPQRQQSFSPPLMDGPPLGGRFVDGTKSMFVKPPLPSPLTPQASISSPLPSAAASTFQSPLHSSASAAFQTPLHTPAPTVATVGAANPLSPGAPGPAPAAFDPLTGRVPVPNGQPVITSNGPLTNDLDPLGGVKPAMMSQSVRVTPTRPRLDAREAASKLANMF